MIMKEIKQWLLMPIIIYMVFKTNDPKRVLVFLEDAYPSKHRLSYRFVTWMLKKRIGKKR